MQIGKVAASAGVSVQTMRFYEREGLIKAPRRLQSGYRDYPEGTAKIVAFIKKNQSSGFTLAEIKSILKLIASGSPAGLNRQRDIQKKIQALDDQIRSLQNIRDELIGCLKRCGCADGQSPCPESVDVADAMNRR
ncbi:MAG TPA: MerR family transcriptional regulator [Blastocatellia bacterium]